MNRDKPTIDLGRRYNVKEICAMLYISRSTITKYTKSEVIVPIRISAREIYYLGSEVEVLFNALTAKRKKKTRHAND